MTNALTLSGTLIVLGLLMMSSYLVRRPSSEMNAAIDLANASPAVPANATVNVFSVYSPRFSTIGEHLANERGDTKDLLVDDGLKIYGLSC